jgi:photosystem II stability/assembly factor-like uncharacterized protein
LAAVTVLLVGLVGPTTVAGVAAPSSEYSNFFDTVTCASQTDCVAVGYSVSAANGDQGSYVEATTTGALAWWLQQAPAGTGQLRAVACPTTQDCFAAGDGQYPGRSRIIATTDGGQIWTDQAIPDASLLGTFTAIKCPTALICYAITGSSNLSSARIVTTTDGGAQWSNQAAPAAVAEPVDLSCPGPATCFVVGSGPLDGTQHPPAAIAATFDGGAQWVSQLSYGASNSDEASAYLDSVSCPEATTCLAVGSGIWGTTDSGATWTLHTTTGLAAADPPLYSTVDCPRTLDCYVGGENTPAGSYGELISTNGGWTFASSPDDGVVGRLNHLSCPAYFRCYAEHDSGGLITTDDSGQIWTYENTPYLAT